MTGTYKLATKKQVIAKDIVRAAKALGLKLWFRRNKQNHSVEFMLLADPLEIKQCAMLIGKSVAVHLRND